MSNYLTLLRDALDGELRPSRAGATRGLFDVSLRYDLSDGFPLLTCRPISFKIALAELRMFLRGETDTHAALESQGITIWKGNTAATGGEMGPIYGHQLRRYGAPAGGDGLDTLEDLIRLLIDDPTSRRLIMTTLHMVQAKEAVLYPCHGLLIQFYVDEIVRGPNGEPVGGRLSVKQTQRSADIYHGLPYNIASYALLVHILCRLVADRTGGRLILRPGHVTLSLGDTHLYENHVAAATAVLGRGRSAPFPTLVWTRATPLLCPEDLADLAMDGYTPCREPLPPAPFNP